ncbi:arylformamidase Ecym_4070 [Eremothecium cymbalariae DBVPG|uniref:BD-FAE-like domain-containing protein n=1 Tax=Eremothecium cymbalariae (strain CBS 270.75 / DBVPG 7215 / KCTC 17166 / NRRL Y-17582) TaxID=931890 RepID=G8JSZ7_ERECY|nr:hypothetical protein Ecym_4070 [Eremothecium cymbalariae DBVPG\
MSNPSFETTAIFHEGSSEAVIYIHGGIWTSTNNTPDDFLKLSGYIKFEAKELSQYSIDYRLSPEVMHPTHLQDCLSNIYKLVKEKHISKLHLVGHSVGATLCWQLVTASDDDELHNQTFLDAHQLAEVQSIVKNVFLVSGIYSLNELIDEYPAYKSYVEDAFESIDDFEDPKVGYEKLWPYVRLHLIYSYKDELVSKRQSNYLMDILQMNGIPFSAYFDNLGQHDDVYESKKLSKYIIKQLR